MTRSAPCPDCGFDPGSVSPADGLVAIRSFPRRYRAALGPVLDDDGGEALARRRAGSDEWSALEHVAHVVDGFVAAAGWVREVRTSDDARIDEDARDSHRSTIAAGGGSVSLALDHLEHAAARLADELAKVDGAEWQRSGAFSDGARTLLDLLRNSVHLGSHHLREAARVLDQVRGR